MSNTRTAIEEVQDTARELAWRPGDKELQAELRGDLGEAEADQDVGEFLAGDGGSPFEGRSRGHGAARRAGVRHGPHEVVG